MGKPLQSIGSLGLGYRVVGGTTGNLQAARRKGMEEKASPRACQAPPSLAKENRLVGLEARTLGCVR